MDRDRIARAGDPACRERGIVMAIELVFNLLFGVGILFYLAQAYSLPATDNPADVLGAGGFPIILGVLALLLLAWITVHVVKEKKKIEVPMFSLASPDGRSLSFNVLLLVAYMALLNVAGFVVSTCLYLLTAGWAIGFRHGAWLVIYAVAVTAVLTVVFGTVFAVPLPRGLGQLRELSYAIY